MSLAPTSPPNARWRPIDVALLLVVLVIATWVRATHVDAAPSFDELWHLADTTGHGSALSEYPYDVVIPQARRQLALSDARPIASLWGDQRDVLHPPLFLLALRVWREAIGEGDLAAHWFSITWGTVGLVFLFAAARLATSRWLAALLTLAVGCAQTQVYVAQEIRPYAMLNAIAAIAVWRMTRVELFGPTRRRAIVLGLITLPLVLTHYFAFGGALAVGAYGVLRLKGHRRVFLATVGACALFFIVAWLPIALRQVPDMAVGGGPLPPHLAEEAVALFASPFRVFADRALANEPLSIVTGVLFVLPWLMVRRYPPLLPWAMWLCATLGCIVALDLARSSFHMAVVRYVTIATPAAALLFVGCAWPVRRPLAYVVAFGLLGVGLTNTILRTDVIAEVPDYADVAGLVSARARPGEAMIVSDASSMRRAPVWLMTLSHEPGFFPRPAAMPTRPMTATMLGQLGTSSAWFVSDEGTSPLALVPGSRVVEEHHLLEGIRVCRLELAPTTQPTTAPAAR